MYNTVVTMGYLASEPELRQTPSGKSVCNFRICVSPKRARNQAFVDVECWNATADNVAKYLSKGRPVLVEAELAQDNWTDKETGGNRSKLFLLAKEIKFVPGGKSDGQGQEPALASSGGGSDDVPF